MTQKDPLNDNTLYVETNPQYTHDCERCVYQGRFNEMDMYICKTDKQTPPTFVLRFGNSGEQYVSMSQDIAKSLPVSPMAALNVLYEHNVI